MPQPRLDNPQVAGICATSQGRPGLAGRPAAGLNLQGLLAKVSTRHAGNGTERWKGILICFDVIGVEGGKPRDIVYRAHVFGPYAGRRPQLAIVGIGPSDLQDRLESVVLHVLETAFVPKID